MPRAGFHDQKLDPQPAKTPSLHCCPSPPLSHCPGQARGDHPDLLPSKGQKKSAMMTRIDGDDEDAGIGVESYRHTDGQINVLWITLLILV